MTARALLLALLVAALTGCAEGPSGARLIYVERTAFGVVEHYRVPGSTVARRLWRPDPGYADRVRWLGPLERVP